MCWPLSRSTPSMATRRARPPRLREDSNTSAPTPRSASATAAARPAQPAPMTATRFMLTRNSGGHPGLPRDPELADRRERRALHQDAVAVARDLAEQRAVDRGHHQPGTLRAAVLGRQQGERFVVAARGAFRLEADETREVFGMARIQDIGRGDVETPEFVHRDIDAA